MKAKAHRILGTLGVALAGGALFAGGVQGAERPDDRGGMIGVGGTQVVAAPPDAFERAVLRNAASVHVPDLFERAVLRSAAANPVPDVFERAVLRESQGVAVRPDDRAGARGPGIVPTALPTLRASTDDGFRWDDAIFGAAAMLGVVLLGAVASLTIRRRSGMALR